MANIPSDVIQLHILPRLPVKSLIRFKSVSKSWQAWIGSPDFIRLHRHNNRSSGKDRFLIMLDQSSHTLHIHELESPSAPPLLLTYPKAAITCTTPIVVEIVASCEGVLLLSCSPRSNRILIRLGRILMRARTHVSDELVLLNPSTGSYYDIPHPSIIPDINDHHSIYGLYHDEANDDFKVAMISQSHNYRSTKSREVMVYSSKTNSWTLIEQKLDISYRIEAAAGAVALIGHLLHTILYSKNGDAFTTRLGCFDIMAEQWTNEVPLPDRFEVDNLTCNRLCVFDGLLCGVMDDVAGHTYQVWVMKEYGVKESWVKLLNSVPSDIYVPYGLDYYLPVTCHEGSRHNILCRIPSTGELFWYDIKTKKVKKLEFDGCRASSSGHIVCNQSLVNFTGGRQINLCRLEIKEEKRKRGIKLTVKRSMDFMLAFGIANFV